jgi:hypothetical protein
MLKTLTKNAGGTAIAATALILTVGLPQSSYAFKYKKARCATWGDSLDQPSAKGRWEWTAKCDKYYDSLVQQFPEMAPSRYLEDENGNNRRTYPVYAVINTSLPEEHAGYYTNPKNWFAPTRAPKGEADLDSACAIPDKYRIGFICLSSCYTPDMMLSFNIGDVDVESAYQENLQDILSVSAESTIEKMVMQYRPVKNHIRSIIDGKHEIIKFLTDSGKVLKVTPNHPLVNGNGQMMRADRFKQGDFLVNVDGGKEKIVALTGQEFHGKVYNVEIDANHYTDQILVAQGLLSGDLSFQNENTRYLERILFRMNGISDEFLGME